MNVKAWLNTLTPVSRTLPIVILYVTEGCNLKCITCSYRETLQDELSLDEIAELALPLHNYGLRHIVYTGGEPLMRRDFPEICRIFGRFNVKQTLLTNGLLLNKRFEEVQNHLTEIIVSIDGSSAGTHNSIRGVPSFDLILDGINRAVAATPRPQISIRTVVQKRNFREVAEVVALAQSLRVDRISFLAADVLSDSFGRTARGSAAPREGILLSEDETAEFRALIGQMIIRFKREFDSKFISESPEKMLHIVQYFEALLGMHAFPKNRCNAPMVSAVITSTGQMLPCFFLPSFGNIRKEPLQRMVNNGQIVSTRTSVKNYALERCQKCVCTLNVSPMTAILDRF